MKIKFYGYNTFIIEIGSKKIAIDPGALFFYFFRFTTLIPESEWEDITHIFVTDTWRSRSLLACRQGCRSLRCSGYLQ